MFAGILCLFAAGMTVLLLWSATRRMLHKPRTFMSGKHAKPRDVPRPRKVVK